MGKNINGWSAVTAYKINDLSWNFGDLAELELLLEKKRFAMCLPTQSESMGFVPALAAVSLEPHFCDNNINSKNLFQMLVCKQERVLPGAVIKKLVAEKVAAVEKEQNRKLLARERRLIKDEVIIGALPKAFLKDTFINVLFDLKAGFLYVGTSSEKNADSVVSLIREAIGSMPVMPAMADICEDSTRSLIAGGKILTGEKLTMVHPLGLNKVTLNGVGINDDEYEALIKNGYRIEGGAFEVYGLQFNMNFGRASFSGLGSAGMLEQSIDEAGESDGDDEFYAMIAGNILLTDALNKLFEVLPFKPKF